MPEEATLFDPSTASAQDDDPGHSLWLACLDQLAQELPPQQFDTWIKPLRAHVAPDLSRVTLYLPNRFKLDWVRKQHAARIAAALEHLYGQPVALELTLAPTAPASAAATRAYTPPPPAAPGPQVIPSPQSALNPASNGLLPASANQAAYQFGGPAPRHSPHAPGPHTANISNIANPNIGKTDTGSVSPNSSDKKNTPAPAPTFQTRLNPALTFESLMEGGTNRMARSAALHIAQSPGQMYNPLFIYGGVGLGKTHLMHAVGNYLIKEKPQARVLYVHAEQFVSDVVKAIQRKSFDEFKAYYHGLDMLLIDDVQFLAGKDRTQDEFFNAFEALLARKSHIVMTGDTYPQGLENIHERLVSRFGAGLTVAVDPPELELRVQILLNKARAESVQMPEDVALFVARNVRSNVRELEGALRKILAYSRFNHEEVSIQLAQHALRDLLSLQSRQITVENIQKAVADKFNIKVADMHSKKRPVSISHPRQIAMYLAKELTSKSLPEIGELFGGRDHTTVLHAVRKITAARKDDAELSQQIAELEQMLKN